MNQQKTGRFLRQLRQEKGLTQEQLAEQFYISSRTVSRWETGSNLPDLEMLIALSDFYATDIREIIDGERKCETMDNETRDTLKKVADYTNQEIRRQKMKMVDMLAGSALLVLYCSLLLVTGAFQSLPQRAFHNLLEFVLGLTLAVLVVNILHLLGVLDAIRQWKYSRKNR